MKMRESLEMPPGISDCSRDLKSRGARHAQLLDRAREPSVEQRLARIRKA